MAWADAPGLNPRMNNRLKITSVVGMSGGALMGYLAARRSPCDPQTLTSRWDDLRPTDVFPRLSVLRFLSILVAQLADLDIERDVLVASITPAWQRDDWKKSDPFLMDFQPQTILDLIRTAGDDAAHGRPARVLSWGEPSLLDAETTPALAALPAAAVQTYLCSEPARLRR